MVSLLTQLKFPSLFPAWFLGVAAGIEIFCALIALMISIFGFKSYKLTGDKKLSYFGFGFLFISFNLFAHALLNLSINFNLMGSIIGKAEEMGIKYLLGVYYFLIIAVLLAYMSFIIIYSKVTRKGSIGMYYLLILIIGLLTFNSYFHINLVSAILAGIIVFYTGKNYLKVRKQKKGSTNALLVVSAFGLISLFHIMFVLEKFHGMFINIKYLVLLAGFICFLTALLKVYYGGKKK